MNVAFRFLHRFWFVRLRPYFPFGDGVSEIASIHSVSGAEGFLIARAQNRLPGFEQLLLSTLRIKDGAARFPRYLVDAVVLNLERVLLW